MICIMFPLFNKCSSYNLVHFIRYITKHFLLTQMLDTARLTQLVLYLICFTGDQVLFLAL